MKKIIVLFDCLLFLAVTGCSPKFTIINIKGIDEEYKHFVCAGYCPDYDGIGDENQKYYNICKINDFKVNKIVKDKVGGTDYIFISYDITSSLVSGDLDYPCSFYIDVYDENGNKLNRESHNDPNVIYSNFNILVTSSGTYQAPMNGNAYSIIVSAY